MTLAQQNITSMSHLFFMKQNTFTQETEHSVFPKTLSVKRGKTKIYRKYDRNAAKHIYMYQEDMFYELAPPVKETGKKLKNYVNNRDLKQRRRGRRRERQKVREKPKGPRRMTGGKRVDVLRSVPT